MQRPTRQTQKNHLDDAKEAHSLEANKRNRKQTDKKALKSYKKIGFQNNDQMFNAGLKQNEMIISCLKDISSSRFQQEQFERHSTVSELTSNHNSNNVIVLPPEQLARQVRHLNVPHSFQPLGPSSQDPLFTIITQEDEMMDSDQINLQETQKLNQEMQGNSNSHYQAKSDNLIGEVPNTNPSNGKRKVRPPSNLTFEMIGSTKTGMSIFNIKDGMINNECEMGAKPLKLPVIPNSHSLFKTKAPLSQKHIISKIQTTISNNDKGAHSAAASMDVMLCRNMDDDQQKLVNRSTLLNAIEQSIEQQNFQETSATSTINIIKAQESQLKEEREDDDDDLLGCHGESILLTDTERFQLTIMSSPAPIVIQSSAAANTVSAQREQHSQEQQQYRIILKTLECIDNRTQDIQHGYITRQTYQKVLNSTLLQQNRSDQFLKCYAQEVTLSPFTSVKERMAVADWMSQFADQYNLQRTTQALAMVYFDKCIQAQCKNYVERQIDFGIGDQQTLLEGIAAICLFIAAKFDETKPPRLSDLLKCVKLADHTAVALRLENIILREVLHWELSLATPLSCLENLIAIWNSISSNCSGGSSQNDDESDLFDYNSDQVSIMKLLHLMEILSFDLYLSTFNPLILSCAVLALYIEEQQEFYQKRSPADGHQHFFSKYQEVIRQISSQQKDTTYQQFITQIEQPVQYMKEAGYIEKLFKRARDSNGEEYDSTCCLSGNMRYIKSLRKEIATLILARH